LNVFYFLGRMLIRTIKAELKLLTDTIHVISMVNQYWSLEYTFTQPYVSTNVLSIVTT
jgi:hypothetical protein